MFTRKYRLCASSSCDHQYKADIDALQDKIFTALAVRLLDRLIQDSKTFLSQELSPLLRKETWNDFKEIGGFTNPKKYGKHEQFIEHARRALVYSSLREELIKDLDTLAWLEAVSNILKIVPDNYSVELLEELLNRVIEEETFKHSPQENNPFEIRMEQVKSTEGMGFDREKTINIKDRDSIIKEIQDGIALSEAARQYSAKIAQEGKDTNNHLKTVAKSLAIPIHKSLGNLYTQRKDNNDISLTNKYFSLLHGEPEIVSYIERPRYQLALRARNILILNEINQSSFFSSKGVESFFKQLKKKLVEDLEILLFFKILDADDSLNNYTENIKSTAYKLITSLHHQLTKCDFQTLPIPDNIKSGTEEYFKYLSESILAFSREREISTEDLFIGNTEKILNNVVSVIRECREATELRDKFKNIFFQVAQEIANNYDEEIEYDRFEQKYFSNNPSNILLEFCRHFLASVDTQSEIEESALLDKGTNVFAGISNFFEDTFSNKYSWTVYIPVIGIKVGNEPQNYCYEWVPVISEISQLKFLGSKILNSKICELNSKFKSCIPFIEEYEAAEACAVVRDIKAGDGFQAAKIAVQILTDTIEAQLFLIPYGYQFQIELLRKQKTQVLCICEKILADNDSVVNASIAPFPEIRRGTTALAFQGYYQEEIVRSAQFSRIISEYSNIDNALGKLSQEILYCLRDYRKGYYSESISERFRLYWSILDRLFSEAGSSKTAKASIPYKVSLFNFGIRDLIKPGDNYTFGQTRLWMREDIEDIYTLVRNPLYHEGKEHAIAFERLMKRFEILVRSILRWLVDTVIYKRIDDKYLNRGIEGIVEFLELSCPDQEQIMKE